MSFSDYGMSILRNNKRLKSGHRAKYFTASTDVSKSDLQFNEEFSFDENDDFSEVEFKKNRKIYIEKGVAFLLVYILLYFLSVAIDGKLAGFMN